MITQERLKQNLFYDKHTGIFTWKIRKSGVTFGNNAGYISDGYMLIRIDDVYYRAHRLAFLYVFGRWPKEEIDHVNHVRDNNMISNLREVSHAENQKNRSMHKNNSSGVTGVSWHKKRNAWQSLICYEGKKIHLGLFENFQEAVKTRKLAEIRFNFHQNHGN